MNAYEIHTVSATATVNAARSLHPPSSPYLPLPLCVPPSEIFLLPLGSRDVVSTTPLQPCYYYQQEDSDVVSRAQPDD
jgi:hypothetical protein